MILKGVPHGFMNFKDANSDTLKSYLRILRLMQKALGDEVPFADVPREEWKTFQ